MKRVSGSKRRPEPVQCSEDPSLIGSFYLAYWPYNDMLYIQYARFPQIERGNVGVSNYLLI